MMEVDRVLRPGGYWVLSGPPINWRNNYQAWQRSEEELQEEQRKIEEIAKLLCWEKKHEKGEIAIWRKRINYDNCRDQDSQPTICESKNADDVWYIILLEFLFFNKLFESLLDKRIDESGTVRCNQSLPQ
jgi:hypothetical protein